MNLGQDRMSVSLLERIDNRISFCYIEHCTVTRQNGALACESEAGTDLVPICGIAVLLIGPGVSVTHRAMELLTDSGTTCVWVGESGVRYYACGKSLNSRSHLAEVQAKYWANPRKHLAVVRQMYQMRFTDFFKDKDTSSMTLSRMRGIEGKRMQSLYKTMAEKYGVSWTNRTYQPGDVEQSDAVNQCLTYANQCLYGLCLSAISMLGLIPSLGFIHVGHTLSLVYDISDLYKTDISIPIAFRIASESSGKTGDEIESALRKAMRDHFYEHKTLKQIVQDLLNLFNIEEETMQFNDDGIWLWNGSQDVSVRGGKLY